MTAISGAAAAFGLAASVALIDLVRADQHTALSASLAIEISRDIGLFLAVAATGVGTVSTFVLWRQAKRAVWA